MTAQALAPGAANPPAPRLFHQGCQTQRLPDLVAAVACAGCGLAVAEPDGPIRLTNTAFWQCIGIEVPPVPPADCLWCVLGEAASEAGREAVAALRARAASAGRVFGEVSLAGGSVVAVDVVDAEFGLRVVSLTDVTDVARQREEAERAARRDPLTGLANRTSFDEALNAALASGSGCQSAVLCIDLDRFKTINDTLGHPVGDALLKIVADRLRSAMREGDLIARLGGDEFAVLQTSGPQPESAASLARRLVDLIGRPYIVGGHLVNIGASIGLAVAPADGGSGPILVRNADLALYHAKDEGRGAFRFFEAGMDARMQDRRNLEIDLRRAIARREMELHYQPQLNLASGHITGFEALLRWSHPERGMVSPLEFIGLAEEIGLIVPIGEWVIRTACREATSWPAGTRVAVNVSAAQLTSDRLVPTVVSALASSGLAADRLEVEITESVLFSDQAGALARLHQLRELGVRVSMDDFGTGYSSLGSLNSLPFDKVKIDQSFVRGETGRTSGAAIVRAIAALGTSLGIATIAEGVETADELERIRAGGCTDIQGYFISRPMPAAQLPDFFTSRKRGAQGAGG